MAGLNGFVKIHRKMIEWGWYADSVVKDVFIHILMIATFKDTTYLGKKLTPGQAVIGRKKMAAELGFSEQQIRTALKKLESTGEISLFSTNKYTIATVVNWAFYQGDDEDSNQQITNNQPTNNQQITNNQPHLKNVKNVKNVKKDINNKGFTPPTIEEVREYCKKKNYSMSPESFWYHYDSIDWYVGKVKMQRWKSAVSGWENRNKDRDRRGGKKNANSERDPERPSYDPERKYGTYL